MADMRTVVMVSAPVVAIATVALGLRVGAGGAVRAAIVHAAPRGNESTAFAWQIGTFLEDRGVREAVAMRGLTVTARGNSGVPEATWRGDSNADGVAEIQLDLPEFRDGGPLWLEVRADGEAAPLASGTVEWNTAFESSRVVESTFVRPTRREGSIALDVSVYGERLTPGYPTPMWIRATDRATGSALAGVSVEAEPEPGLTLAAPRATTCAAGFAELSAVAIVHVVGVSLHARTADGRTGDFFAGLPVAAGAYAVAVPPHLGPGVPKTFDIVAPNARTVVYAEIDDARGRIFAAALPLATDGATVPHAALAVPPLSPGLHWLTTSGDPQGAEGISGATVARPFWVTGEPAKDPCATNASLGAMHARGFPRWLALDGFQGRRAASESRRRRGLILAFASLATAAALEMLLVFQGARRATRDLDRAEISGRSSAGSLAVGLLLALLGFALLASLLGYRG